MNDLREQLADEIEVAIDNVHDMDVTHRDYANASADAIIAALPGMVPQWQPIETAPTDYTEVIGIDAKGRIAKTWFFAPSAMTRDWMRCGWGKQRPWNPTHWTPLPAAPGVQGGET